MVVLIIPTSVQKVISGFCPICIHLVNVKAKHIFFTGVYSINIILSPVEENKLYVSLQF